MDELNERELFRVRFRFLDLIKSFFALEPDSETMSRWRELLPRFPVSR